MDDALRSLLRPELAELHSYVPADPPGIVARLDANEAPAAVSPALHAAVVAAVARTPLERYPDARATRLREAIAHRTGAKVDELLIGTGSDEVISLILNALARPQGKSPQGVVLTTTPTFVMYRVTARAHGLKTMEVPLDATWDLPVEGMKRAIETLTPNVVFVASPNNPTSNRMSEDRIVALCEAARSSFVVLDEAYVDYAGASLRSLRARFPNLGVLRTLSKIGLAALRVGWLEADAELVREIDKGRQPFNVSATSQEAAAAVLTEAWPAVESEVRRVLASREKVAAEIAKVRGFTVGRTDANFLWVKTEKPAKEVVDALAARGVLVRSFHGAGGRMAHQIRVSIGAERDTELLLEAMRAFA
jgi:histidinol-phosphate aminotransferase